MNQRESQRKKNIYKSGIFFLFFLIVSGLITIRLSKERALFEKKVTLHAIVSNAQNLKEGAAVQLKGIKVGTVQEIIFQGINQIRINFEIKESNLSFIKKDAYVTFKTQGVLGDKMIEILGGSENSPTIGAGDQIQSEEKKGLDEFVEKGEHILLSANKVLSRIDRILAQVESAQIDKLVNQSERLMKSVDAKLNDKNLDQLLAHLNLISKEMAQTSASAARITKQIETGPGTLNALIYDRSLYDDLKSITGGAERNKVLKYFIRETIKQSNK